MAVAQQDGKQELLTKLCKFGCTVNRSTIFAFLTNRINVDEAKPTMDEEESQLFHVDKP